MYGPNVIEGVLQYDDEMSTLIAYLCEKTGTLTIPESVNGICTRKFCHTRTDWHNGNLLS